MESTAKNLVPTADAIRLKEALRPFSWSHVCSTAAHADPGFSLEEGCPTSDENTVKPVLILVSSTSAVSSPRSTSFTKEERFVSDDSKAEVLRTSLILLGVGLAHRKDSSKTCLAESSVAKLSFGEEATALLHIMSKRRCQVLAGYIPCACNE